MKHPSTWDKEVYDQLGEAWRSSEGIGYFYEAELEDEDLFIQKAVDSLLAMPKADEKTKEIEALQRKIDSLKASGENQ